MENNTANQTPEQISKAAFDASANATTAAEYLAAVELHRIAIESGVAKYLGGHALAVNNDTLRARSKSNKALANTISRIEQSQIGR